MRALVLSDQGLEVQCDRPLPTIGDGEVLVRVLRAGVCETDLQLMQGYMGFRGVLGHEFVGIAEEGVFEGQRVVGEINCNCRRCEYCDNDLGNHCRDRTVIGILNHDGAFAEYLAVPEHRLHAVPAHLTTDEAVFTEPLAAAYQIPAQLRLQPGQRVVVLGDGRLGNLCAQVASAYECNVTVVGKHASKLQLLSDLGIDTQRLEDVSDGQFADIVVDCTGSSSGMDAALSIVRPRGTIVLKTTLAREHKLSLAPLVIDEINVMGSRCGPFADAITALSVRQVEVVPLISARYPLDDGIRALEHARAPETLKVLFDVADDRASAAI